ncbi:MAG: GNAT family N-acetyltransferase [Symbiobacteriia bacterium]
MGTMLSGFDLRLRLAELPRDVAAAVPWYQDPEVLRFSEGEGTPPYDATMVERMYRYLSEHGELYLIEVREGKGNWHAIGDATLCRDSLPLVIGEPEYRSRGLGKRVLRSLIDRARELGWAELQVKRVFTYNARSRRLFEGAGFTLAGSGTDEDGRPYWSFRLSL